MKPSRSVVTIALLIAALVGSNAWWGFTALDAGVTAAYRDQAFEEHRQALSELLAVVPAATGAATRDAVLEAARSASNDHLEFEKEGYTWVGHLGYRFDSNGRLVDVQTKWSPF